MRIIKSILIPFAILILLLILYILVSTAFLDSFNEPTAFMYSIITYFSIIGYLSILVLYIILGLLINKKVSKEVLIAISIFPLPTYLLEQLGLRGKVFEIILAISIVIALGLLIYELIDEKNLEGKGHYDDSAP